ncbi:MAG: hydrogenase maturation nickel metallochaperone HypA [Bacteroidales bacterium]|nr:hydrogenase maturation nickel metallochaperone HypA [Bacteroidales bacterium]
MHEFSLARNIIEIVTETALKNKLRTIGELVLEIGTLSGVEVTALDMALESLQPGSVLEGATIIRDIVEASARCLECQKEFIPDDFYCACPHCGSFSHEVLQGKELRIKSISGE